MLNIGGGIILLLEKIDGRLVEINLLLQAIVGIGRSLLVEIQKNKLIK